MSKVKVFTCDKCGVQKTVAADNRLARFETGFRELSVDTIAFPPERETLLQLCSDCWRSVDKFVRAGGKRA